MSTRGHALGSPVRDAHAPLVTNAIASSGAPRVDGRGGGAYGPALLIVRQICVILQIVAEDVQQWRTRSKLTQVEAAVLLGVSQPYLSLLESGARPLTLRLRSRLTAENRDTGDDRFRAQLSALGYELFAHLRPARLKPRADSLLVSILSQPDLDARVVAALPWLVRTTAKRLDFTWLVRQAKLRNIANRMGFVLELAGVESVGMSAALRELEAARLLAETTLCWDAMPTAVREWMRGHRSAMAARWNVLSRAGTAESTDAE